MAKSSIALRNAALTALLAAGGCGGDDNHNTATTDSGSPDTGIAYDAGALNDAATLPDAAILDASASDSSVAFDAATTDAAAPDASAPDAGDPELAAALNTDGVVVTMQRAELLVAAVCHTSAQCDPAEVSEQECVRLGMSDWSDPSIYASMEDWPCDDATLDIASCEATAPCDQSDACTSFEDTRARLCADDAGT